MKINLTKNTDINKLKSDHRVLEQQVKSMDNAISVEIRTNPHIKEILHNIRELENKRNNIIVSIRKKYKFEELRYKLYNSILKITQYYNDIEDDIPEDIAKHFKLSYSGTTSQDDGSLSVVWWGFEESKDFYIVKEKGKSYWSGIGCPRGYSPTTYKLFCTKINNNYHGIAEFEGKISKAKVKILEDKMIEIINEKKTKKRK